MLQRIARLVSQSLGRDSRLIKSLRPGYESALDYISGGRGVQWKINGAPFRIDPCCWRANQLAHKPRRMAQRVPRVQNQTDTAIRIGIDALAWNRGNGCGRYCHDLVSALLLIPTHYSFTLLMDSDTCAPAGTEVVRFASVEQRWFLRAFAPRAARADSDCRAALAL